jgi:DnaJ like chaperone protein
MSSFASLVNPFFATQRSVPVNAAVVASHSHLESVAFNHALVALAAKLAGVDGAPNKAEYAAFHALFDDGDAQEISKNRSLFIQRITDNSSALQYARQIAGMSTGNGALHRDLLQRLMRVATADAMLNAAELELLRAVADIFGIARETFRDMVSQTMVKASASPYTMLGVSPRVTDAELREQYMAQVQKLHPDRYQGVGASAETIAMLSDQLATINAAYKTITSQRAKKSQRTDHSTGWFSRLNAKGASVN